MRIGIFGGTFDPIHLGHLIVMQNSINYVNLDKIIVLPTSNPPHKLLNTKSDVSVRVEMVNAAIKCNKKLELSTYESSSNEIHYSFNTMRHFKKVYPNDELFYIMGEDSLRDIELWEKYKILLSENNIIVFTRFKNDEDFKIILEKYKKIAKNIIVLDQVTTSISSTLIREMVKNKLDINYLVPEEVEKIILSRNLYE
ncbi:MAG: nicotinate (nicotinamide) nucleotide adenylyltransferase [Peptoniphilaceae bacterium]|nr:nicotinate (nicotinamide) nucleotide adenylyltransferase [Peptoniphilaceae bacterium]MDD7383477.1 nicotinate (nicotinamide) nucleotide adenylyltransferase [Peptoniphilaceae bacterium]MDY3738461.1 nicotinate (nicotinamide) nucleotide adenylyltransferase [Peptoniphilaceae bacterium]